MKIIAVKSLAIPEIRVVRFGRFLDSRGFFTEPFRRSDFENHPETSFFQRLSFPQSNESWSRAGVIRGLHFQWNPFMGKLVRTVAGHMCDLVLDIRKGSPTVGKIVAYDMPSQDDSPWGEWIWVPPGFAHGNFFTEPTRIEYLCSGEYSPGCEAGISPLAEDIDWSFCDAELQARFRDLLARSPMLTDKDRDGLTVAAWLADPRSEEFIYGKC